jgi:hypothetical protein
MKYVNIRMPEAGPLGETFFDVRARAIAGKESSGRMRGIGLDVP